MDSLGDGTPPVFSLPDSFLGGVGRTVRARGKTSGGYIAVWARVVGKRARCPGSKYMHYLLENGSTNGRNYSMTLKMGLGYKALERVNRAAALCGCV